MKNPLPYRTTILFSRCVFMEEQFQSFVETFFEKFGVDYSNISVKQEAEHIYRISLQTKDSALLIGPHGKNLDTLSHILKLLLSKIAGTHLHVHVEVNDYLEKKDEKLLAFIQSKIDLVQKTGKEIILPFLSSYERKKVHSYVSEHSKNVYTQSL